MPLAQQNRDIDRLHELVRQPRAELRALRVEMGDRGVRGEPRREHGEGSREDGGEHREGRREGRGGRGEGEESGKRIAKHETWDATRNGARLSFTWWMAHPEHGSEEGHGAERGERGGGRGADQRPEDLKLRPLYNQLLLLRREVRMLAEHLRAKRRCSRKL
ncbi:MAG: hypothetical protein ACE5F1_09360 [Planctomycetota bacterium]